MLNEENTNKEKTVIIDYGAGNIQSIKFALLRQGFEGILSNNAEEIMGADRVIFPGVGEASSAMRKLRSTGLDHIIPQLTQPVLGICLGMQLMCSFSEEGSTKGLGIFEVEVKKFSSRKKVPQIGWNRIKTLNTPIFEGISENEFVYLVHSFYAPICGQTMATTEYGFSYSAALHKNNFYGLQFHPEKSGNAGEQILKNFLKLDRPINAHKKPTSIGEKNQ